MTLGRRVRAARTARRMTQKQLGAGTLSGSFISMVEHDRVRPSLATLQILSERLQQPLAHFLDAAPPPAEQADVLIRRGEALLRQHRFTEAMEAFSAAGGPAELSGAVTLGFRCELGLGTALTGVRQFDLAGPHLRAAQELAEAAGDAELLAAAAHARGFLAFRGRRFAEAREIAQDGVDRLRARGVDDGEIMGKLLALLGRISVELGLPAQALECYRLAAGILQRAADPSHQALLHFNIGIAYERQQSFEHAKWHLQEAANLFALQENLGLLGVAQRSLGILHLEQGNTDGALAMLVQSLRAARQVGDDEGAAQSMVELARAQLAAGDTEEARRTAQEAQALAGRLDDGAETARAQTVLAAVAQVQGETAEATAQYRSAIAAFERLELRDDLARACRDLGFVLMEQGEMDAAARRFAQALAGGRDPTALREHRR